MKTTNSRIREYDFIQNWNDFCLISLHLINKAEIWQHMQRHKQ